MSRANAPACWSASAASGRNDQKTWKSWVVTGYSSSLASTPWLRARSASPWASSTIRSPLPPGMSGGGGDEAPELLQGERGLGLAGELVDVLEGEVDAGAQQRGASGQGHLLALE